MSHEEVYAEEVQEEVLESQSSPKRPARIRTSEDLTESDNEDSPLIGNAHARRSHRRGYSYERAINEPWTGAHGKGPQPWYKKPSVRVLRFSVDNVR